MSWLNNFLTGLEKVFAGNSQASQAVTQLKTSAQTTVDTVAETAANAALAAIPGGALFEGLADDVIPIVIGKLFAAASTDVQAAIKTQLTAS